MADPFSMAIISMGMTAGGGLLSAFGAGQSASAASGMHMYQAGLADFNSRIAKQNAIYASISGEQNAALQGLKYKQAIGDAIAKGGASGIAVGHGSSKEVLDSMSKTAYLDQSIIRSNSARTAYGYEIEANKQTIQGQVYRGAADDDQRAGKIAAWSSILGSASSVSSKWSQGQASGTFS